MECEACGDAISLSTAYRTDDGNFVCQECHVEAKHKKAATQQKQPARAREGAASQTQKQHAEASQVSKTDHENSSQTQSQQPGQYATTGQASEVQEAHHSDEMGATSSQSAQKKFRTLLRLGKFISGTGWAITLVGVLSCLGGVGLLSGGGFGAITGIVALTMGVVISGLGLLMAASGQQISCFVAIEHNTRSTLRLIQERDD